MHKGTLRYNILIAFFILLGVEVVFLLWDILGHHMFCHDTIAGFFIQYYRLNGIVQDGQVPLWSPFMTQGTSMAWWYALQGGPSALCDALALLGGFLKRMDFFALFHVGVFFDQLVLFLGVWLLSGRYFKSVATRVFLMLCIVSSFVLYMQAFAMALFFLVPLLIWLLYRFMDTGQWRWLFFAAYLYLVQVLSSNVGVVPISALAIVVYFLFDVCNQREYYLECWGRLKFDRHAGWCLAGILSIALLVLIYLRLAQDPWTVNGNVLREPDGSVSIGTFLTYAGNTHLNKWYELVFRFTPAMDFTLYMGMFALPCVIGGLLFSRRAEMRAWLGWTSVIFLLSIGSLFAVVLYYFWPPMHFYRHLTLISPVVKFGLCFLAAFGFDALFMSPEARGRGNAWSRNIFWSVMALSFVGAGLFMLRLISDAPLREWIVSSMVTMGLPSFAPASLNADLMPALTAAFAVAAGCSMMVFIRSPRAFFIAAWMWVGLQALDIYDYRIGQMHLRSVPADAGFLKAMRWEPLPWRARRDPATWVDDGRAVFLGTKIGLEHTVHNFVGNFTFRDHMATAFRTDQWSRSLDHYLRAYMGVPFDMPGNINVQTPYMLQFRLDIPSALKISGVTEDKVQVFTSAYYFSSPEKVAAAMTSKAYAGDVLLLSSYQGKPFSGRADDPVDATALASDARIRGAYRMVRYTPNEVVIEASAPQGRPSWLLYSDMWHPGWRAEVNGKAVPVYAANLAYKAVPLAPGKNEVHFYFSVPAVVFFHWLFAGLSLGFIGLAGAICWRAVRDECSNRMEGRRA